MCRRNFRVKVDLSKFYNDVRQSSWIYVDKTTVANISHLQKHITKVFDIQRPIHLLLDSGEYLPPNEDSRILKEDETIVVVPGTGLQNNHSNPLKTTSESERNSSCVISQQKRCVSPTIPSPAVKGDKSSDEEDELAANLMETTDENTVFFSMMNDSQMDSTVESKPEVTALGESLASETSPLKNKRKRVRRKKSKNATLPEQQPVANGGGDVEYKKPKIIDSVTIPNGKHIRFGDVDTIEFQGYDSSASNDSKRRDSRGKKNGIEDSYWDKPVAGSNLANLLALRQSSTPITFGRKKTEETICQGNPEAREVKETESQEKLILKKDYRSLTVDPKRHPLMENKARINDVIAFKMLKMASDYTPQISEYILAQPIQISADGLTYMFKVLDGKDEVQAPQGKFDLQIDEDQNTGTDLISLNWSQLIEPRLIYRE